MTPGDRKKLWSVIYKLHNMPYTGSGYPAYDNVKNPALRGGRYYWMYPDMIELWKKLVTCCEAGNPASCWRILQGYKTKIYPAYLRKIYYALSCGGPFPPTPPANAELREDGSYELREDGGYELRE